MDVTGPPFLTPECILQTPGFSAARDAYIDAVLALYEARPALIELMRDGGRIMVYGAIMALWGDYREADAATSPTISRLKRVVGWFDVASPRQIDLIVARFTQVGHLQVLPAPRDLRLRLVLPTPALCLPQSPTNSRLRSPHRTVHGLIDERLPIPGTVAARHCAGRRRPRSRH